MSIMDYDHKYLKLRKWREQHGLMVAPLPEPPQPTIMLRFSCLDVASAVISGMVVSPAMAERLARIETVIEE